MVVTGFPPRERERVGAQLDCMRELLREAEDVRRTGSAALDLAYVACGRSDAYFEAGVKPWDIAAGVLLVREAGGRVCDFRGARTGPAGHGGHSQPPGHRRQRQGRRCAAEDDRVVGVRQKLSIDASRREAACALRSSDRGKSRA